MRRYSPEEKAGAVRMVRALRAELGLPPDLWQQQEVLDLFTGNALPAAHTTYASVYSGHQFGQWAGQLGDGRALGGNQLLGQLSAFARRNQPAYDVAAEDVQNDVEVKASPLGRPLEFGNVPRPDLVGRQSQQLWLGIDRVAALAAALGAAGVGAQQSVHGAHRPQVTALVEQRGVHRRWSAVTEALAAQCL